MSLDAAHVLDGYEVMGSAMNRWSPYVLSILRIITAFLYMVHGTQRLFGFPAPFPVPHLPERPSTTEIVLTVVIGSVAFTLRLAEVR